MVFFGNALNTNINKSSRERQFYIPAAVDFGRAQSIVNHSSEDIEGKRWKNLVSNILKDVVEANVTDGNHIIRIYKTVVEWNKNVNEVSSANSRRLSVMHISDWCEGKNSQNIKDQSVSNLIEDVVFKMKNFEEIVSISPHIKNDEKVIDFNISVLMPEYDRDLMRSLIAIEIEAENIADTHNYILNFEYLPVTNLID